jgi:hypothetical protein
MQVQTADGDGDEGGEDRNESDEGATTGRVSTSCIATLTRWKKTIVVATAVGIAVSIAGAVSLGDADTVDDEMTGLILLIVVLPSYLGLLCCCGIGMWCRRTRCRISSSCSSGCMKVASAVLVVVGVTILFAGVTCSWHGFTDPAYNDTSVHNGTVYGGMESGFMNPGFFLLAIGLPSCLLLLWCCGMCAQPARFIFCSPGIPTSGCMATLKQLKHWKKTVGFVIAVGIAIGVGGGYQVSVTAIGYSNYGG